MDVPEVHAHAHGGTGHRWLDLAVALAALVTSAVSIVIAVHHGETMERLVEAQSWPSVSFDSSNAVDGNAIVKLSLTSQGTGPARIRSFVLSYDGRLVSDWTELFRRCCSTDPKASREALIREVGEGLLSGSPTGRVLLPGDRQLILSYAASAAASPTNLPLWKRLDDRRNRIGYDLCYCSVFQDCYRLQRRWDEPRRVDDCIKGPGQWNG